MTEKVYTDSHEWVEKRGNLARIGITLLFYRELEEVIFAEFVPNGTTLQKGERMVTLESHKMVFDLYTPLSGTLFSFHKNFLKCCAQEEVKEEDLWLIELIYSPNREEEWQALLSAEQYS